MSVYDKQHTRRRCAHDLRFACYQVGNLLASSVSYGEAVFARRSGYATSLAVTAAIVFVLAAIATAAGRERRGATFGA